MVLFALVPIGTLYAQEDTSISLSDCRTVLEGEVDISFSTEEWYRCTLMEMADGQPENALRCLSHIDAKHKKEAILLTEAKALLQTYRFEESTAITGKLKKNRNYRNVADSLLNQIQRTQRFVDNCVRVEVTDSTRLEHIETLASLKLLSAEWGAISFEPLTGNWIYKTALGYETFHTKLDEDGISHIYYRRAVDDEVIEERELTELNTPKGEFYPILRQDGETLYFASYSDEGMGGMELFVARRDPDTRQFLRPTLLGAPFNSPFDDCFLIFDDLSGKGILASGRFAPKGTLNLYTFVLADFFPPIPANSVEEKITQAKLMPWRMLMLEEDAIQ